MLFDLARQQLVNSPTPPAGLFAADIKSLDVKSWEDSATPTIDGRAIALDDHEQAHALAIAPDTQSFVLGAEFTVRAFDRSGQPKWQQPAPAAARGVNIPKQGKLLVVAYDDGTVRWYRLADGGFHNGSAGGAMLGGEATPNHGQFRTYTVTGGQVTATYSDAGLFVDTGNTAAAVLSVLPATPTASKIGERPFAAVTVTLAGMDTGSREFAVAFAELKRDVIAHAQQEERDEHPQLLADTPAAELDRRVARFEQVEQQTFTA